MKALFENNHVVSNKISSNSIFKLSTSEKDPLEYYEHEVQGLVNSEIRTIHVLNFGIKMLETSVTSTQSAPQIFSSKLLLKRGGKTFLDEVNTDDKKDHENFSMCILS
ncbi:MAG: hypothetical protein HYX60_02175 [Legionella longbeachae]|nr:hypothetical protein [Legionella longbeachae]